MPPTAPTLITLTTDFGLGSPYVAEMKGVLLGVAPHATLVDVTHAVPPQDVRQAALVLDQVADSFPLGSIHVAVVDPGVGTARRLLLAELNQRLYLAPDNGLLSLLAERWPPGGVWSLDRPECWRAPVSRTFHGRDILAPVAARLALGAPPAQFGSLCDSFVKLAWPRPARHGDWLQGEVRSIDRFGNLATNLPAAWLAGAGEGAQAELPDRGARAIPLVETYGAAAAGELVALVGSAERLEIAVVGGNAAARLGAQLGDAVGVRLGPSARGA